MSDVHFSEVRAVGPQRNNRTWHLFSHKFLEWRCLTNCSLIWKIIEYCFKKYFVNYVGNLAWLITYSKHLCDAFYPLYLAIGHALAVLRG